MILSIRCPHNAGVNTHLVSWVLLLQFEVLTETLKISRRIQARSGTKLLISAPCSVTRHSSLAIAPGTSGIVTLNFTSRPAAAIPRSIARDTRLLFMFPPVKIHTTLAKRRLFKTTYCNVF